MNNVLWKKSEWLIVPEGGQNNSFLKLLLSHL